MSTMTLQIPSAQITPAMRRRITAARKEYAQGKTVSCKTKAEMQRHFDGL